MPDTISAAPTIAVQRPVGARTRLLLEGPIVSTLLRLAAPNVIVNVVLIAVTASVDAHFVGRLSADALAGLALVFPLLMLMQQMANSSMGGAISSAVARALGAGRREEAAALVAHGLLIACFIAALFMAVLLIAGPRLYSLMGGDGAILAAAVEYSNAIFLGAVTYWLLGALTSAVRGTGQPAMLAVVYLAAEFLHVLLVPVLVFGWGPIPALGITGAGIATVTSFSASAVVLAWYLASGRTAVRLTIRGVRLDWRLFAEILRVGAPMSFQPMLNNLTLATLTGFVGMLGATALAGFGAAVRLEYVQYPLTFGLGAGLIAMMGTNIGAGQCARAARIAWTAAAVAAGMTGGIGLLALIWPSLWAALFSPVPAVQLAAGRYLSVVCLAFPCLGIGITLSSAFQATGQPLWPLLGAASRALVVAVGGWLIIHATDTGLLGLAAVAAAGQLMYGALLAIAFRAGVWKAGRCAS